MATIAEKSRTKEIIDRLQGIINNASAVPLAPGKISVFKDEVQSLLTELATQIEIELKTYHEVNDRKGKIISEAKKEAEKIIYQAEHSASRMRVSRHTTDVAPLDYDTLNEEERSALGNANEIYGASLIYTDEMLTEVTELISDAYHNIRSDYEIILQVLEEKLDIINNNRAELMDGLQEMDTADRSQQILEIGQLLSSELHMSRMKARMNSDEYEDGSIQLSLDLQEEQEEKARLAEEKAQQAAVALAEMTAERDALMATVEKMKKDGMKGIVHGAKNADMALASVANQAGLAETAAAAPAFVKMMNEPAKRTMKEREPEPEEEVEYEIVYVTEDELEEGEEYEIEYVDDEIEEDVEYEIEYVNEEDLEEGEEYEIEYVDEEEVKQQPEKDVQNNSVEKQATAEQIMNDTPIEEKTATDQITEASPEAEKVVTQEVEEENASSATTEKKPVAEQQKSDKQKPEEAGKKLEDNEEPSEEIKEAIKELEEMEKEDEKIPLIPHFKKTESVASVPSEKIAKMATAITTEKKYSGLISRAVKQREKAEEEAAVKVEKAEITAKETVKDEDIKTDADGKEYVQATMQFDEDFEIMEF